MRSTPFHPHVDDFDIAVLNGPHKALVQIVVDICSVEVWVVKNLLYQILQLSSVVTVLTDVFLQNAFAL